MRGSRARKRPALVTGVWGQREGGFRVAPGVLAWAPGWQLTSPTGRRRRQVGNGRGCPRPRCQAQVTGHRLRLLEQPLERVLCALSCGRGWQAGMMGTDCKAQVPALPAARPGSHGVCPSVSLSPAGTRASCVHSCTLPGAPPTPAPRPPCARGEVPVGNLPLPLPRNTGTNLCLRPVPGHPHHPGHGHPFTPRPPAQALSHPDLPGCNAWDRVPPAAA